MLVYPIFVTSRAEDKEIVGFSPNKQWGRGPNGDYASLVAHLKELETKGLRSVMLFGVVDESLKDPAGSIGYDKDTPVCKCLAQLRISCPNLQLLADVCLCEYTSHGHCGVLHGDDVIDNEATLGKLELCARAYAEAGAHMVCPSDMMDNRIETIRRSLDESGFHHVSIMAYTSKKASCMYAPFRAAVESSFKGNRRRYQQPVGSAIIAQRAQKRDCTQGADVVLVKPSLWYCDIIRSLSQQSDVPIAAYVVSGEYKMLQDYANATGDLGTVLKESHIALVRAGASILVTYFTPVLLDLIPTW